MVLTTALIMFSVLIVTLLLGFPIAISVVLSSILAILPSLALDNTINQEHKEYSQGFQTLH